MDPPNDKAHTRERSASYAFLQELADPDAPSSIMEHYREQQPPPLRRTVPLVRPASPSRSKDNSCTSSPLTTGPSLPLGAGSSSPPPPRGSFRQLMGALPPAPTPPADFDTHDGSNRSSLGPIPVASNVESSHTTVNSANKRLSAAGVATAALAGPETLLVPTAVAAPIMGAHPPPLLPTPVSTASSGGGTAVESAAASGGPPPRPPPATNFMTAEEILNLPSNLMGGSGSTVLPPGADLSSLHSFNQSDLSARGAVVGLRTVPPPGEDEALPRPLDTRNLTTSSSIDGLGSAYQKSANTSAPMLNSVATVPEEEEALAMTVRGTRKPKRVDVVPSRQETAKKGGKAASLLSPYGVGRNVDSYVYLNTHVLAQKAKVTSPASRSTAGGLTGLLASVWSPRVLAAESGRKVLSPRASSRAEAPPAAIPVTRSRSDVAVTVLRGADSQSTAETVQETTAAAAHERHRRPPSQEIAAASSSMPQLPVAAMATLCSSLPTGNIPVGKKVSSDESTATKSSSNAGANTMDNGNFGAGSTHTSQLPHTAHFAQAEKSYPPAPFTRSQTTGYPYVRSQQQQPQPPQPFQPQSSVPYASTVVRDSPMVPPLLKETAPDDIRTVEEALLAVRSTATLPPRRHSAEDALVSLTSVRTRGISLFALFGMLERASRFIEFLVLFRSFSEELTVFFESVSQHIRELNWESEGAAAAALSVHENFMYLLRNPEEYEKVGEEFYSDRLNAWPLQMIYVVCCFFVTTLRCGYEELFTALKETGGVMSVGKGLFAALAVAMSPRREDLARNTAYMYVAAFYVGVMMRQLQEEVGGALLQCTNRNFALLLVNIPIFTLRKLVEQVNFGRGVVEYSSLRPHSEIEVSRVLSSRSAVVCGHPLDLLRLDIVLTRYADFNGVKIHKDYIPSTAPENSGYYNRGMVFDLLSYWDALSLTFDPTQLRLRVYSPVDGEVWDTSTLHNCNHFSLMVAQAATYSNHDLTYALQHMHDGDVLLDFTTMSLSVGPLIAWTNKDIKILSLPRNIREMSVLPPPRRSPQDSAVRGTLWKLSVINNVLRDMKGVTMPSCGFVELFTTFEQLGLLHRVPNGRSAPAQLSSITASPLSSHVQPFGAVEGGGNNLASSTEMLSMPLLSSGYGTGLHVGGNRSMKASLQYQPPSVFGQMGSSATPPLTAEGPKLSPVGEAISESSGTNSGIAPGGGGAGGRASPPSEGESKRSSSFMPQMKSPAYSPVEGDQAAVSSAVPLELSEEYVVQENQLFPGIINVFQVSPLIKYYEMQFGNVMREGAVRFIHLLNRVTGMDFPPYTLLICPTVFAFLELWDTFEFISVWCGEATIDSGGGCGGKRPQRE